MLKLKTQHSKLKTSKACRPWVLRLNPRHPSITPINLTIPITSGKRASPTNPISLTGFGNAAKLPLLLCNPRIGAQIIPQQLTTPVE